MDLRVVRLATPVTLALLASCGGGGSDVKAPSDPTPPSSPPPVGADAHITVVGAAPASSFGSITVHLQNTGGPGTFKLEFYGLPTSPNGADTLFVATQPVDVAAGYDDSVTYVVRTSTSDPPVAYVLVYSRTQGSDVYADTDRFDFATGPIEPPGPLSHVGLPFGPAHSPSERFAEFSGTLHTATDPDTLIRDLEAARRANARLLISFTGNEQYLRDSDGFSLAKWKQRVDRFRGLDLTPYIADGTIVGHFILDEPADPTNWNGKRVSQADIEEIARYSKEIWPSMATVIRTFPEYLVGYQYPHLDAVQVQYHDRFGSLEDFITTHVQSAKSLGLALVGGLNMINGGSKDSGIPGRRAGKHAMSADELRSWGGRYLAEPYICAFILWEYDSTYLSRPDIQGALSDLSQIARSHPAKACRP
jgi:hypothetical protein